MTRANIYIIPGVGQTASDYKNLRTMITQTGNKPIPINVDWKTSTLEEWIVNAEQQIQEHEFARFDHEPKAIIGFSYGGIIAMHLAILENCQRIFCSVPDVYDLNLRKKLDAVTHKIAKVKMNWNELDAKRPVRRPLISDGDDYFLNGSAESNIYQESKLPLIARLSTLFWDFTVQDAIHDVNSNAYVSKLHEVIELSKLKWDKHIPRTRGISLRKIWEMTLNHYGSAPNALERFP